MADRIAPHIVRNSPIEFVISGPVGGRDRVLVRTEKASLDLVALSSQNTDFECRRPSSDPFVALLGGRSRQLNVISSMTVPDFRRDTDSRRSSLNFAWIGLASTIRTEQIRKTFNRCLPDLFHALETGTEDDVEFSVAPIILACSEAHERRKRIHRALYTVLGAYAVIGVAILAYSLLKGTLHL